MSDVPEHISFLYSVVCPTLSSIPLFISSVQMFPVASSPFRSTPVKLLSGVVSPIGHLHVSLSCATPSMSLCSLFLLLYLPIHCTCPANVSYMHSTICLMLYTYFTKNRHLSTPPTCKLNHSPPISAHSPSRAVVLNPTTTFDVYQVLASNGKVRVGTYYKVR